MNTAQQPAFIKTKNGAADLTYLSYTYDVNANISTITDHKDASYNQVMGFDGLDRLTSASGKWGSSTSFTYDTLGNITSKNLGSMAVSYNYDPTTKRLNSANVSGSKNKAYTFTYNTKGAVTHNGTVSLPRNQAGQVTHATGNYAYIYDGNGKRVKDDKNNTARYSIYDLTGKMVYQWDRATETITDYIFLGSEMIVEAQVGMGNGSQNVNNTNVGYTGHQWDNDTGLNYMQARYYDPLLARFMSNDPADFSNIHNFNRYTYVNNNPYKYTDPDGQNPEYLAGVSVGIAMSPEAAAVASAAEASVGNGAFGSGV